jgi:hypothetical protein
MEEELEELMWDIKANGLQHPLVIAEVDGAMMLVDGRNCRFACRALGIVPDHVLLDGQDPVAYILSANINRRHMSKGQRAMVVARIYPWGREAWENSNACGLTPSPYTTSALL